VPLTAPSRVTASVVTDDALQAAAGGVVTGLATAALRLEGRRGPVTVHVDRTGFVPRGIALAGTADLRHGGPAVGARARLRGEVLAIGGALEIDTAGARHTASRILPAGSPAPGPHAAAAVRAVAGGLAANPGPGSLFHPGATRQSSMVRRARGSRARLVTALRSGDHAAALEAAAVLVGLGPGLTPSGDDLLVGTAAVLVAWEWPGAHSFLAACARQARGRTTPEALDLLRHAAHGRFAQPLHDVVGALDADDPATARWATSRLATVGATSGGDLLAGVLAGVAAVRPASPGAQGDRLRGPVRSPSAGAVVPRTR
jgi:Protein of unknown function (DUF2877)